MIKNLFTYAVLILMALSFSDCTVQKRTYRDGYYVSWNKKASVISKLEKSEVNSEPFVIASTGNNLTNDLFSIKKLPSISNQDTCGDKIFMRNGQDILAKVIEVNPKTIKYKQCDNLDGPLFVVGVDKIAMIQYANGVKETFAASEVSESQPDYASAPTASSTTITRNGGEGRGKEIIKYKTIDEKKLVYHKYAMPAFILGFFFWLIVPGILSIIYGILALKAIKRNPEKYKGEILAGFWIYVFSGILFLILLSLLVNL